MVTKKKTVTPIVTEDKKIPLYIPMFTPITITTETKYELNYISVRRKIQKFNFFKSISKWIKEDMKKTYKEKYRFTISKFNLWSKYCIWFNSKFNKKGKTLTEEFNHE